MEEAKCIMGSLLMKLQLIGTHPTLGQQYFTSSEGRANIHFIVEGEFHTASTNSVEIIYNLRDSQGILSTP